MKFFSKIVTFCNIAFIIAAIMRLIKIGEEATKGSSNSVQPTNIIVGTILILSVFAILFNLIFIILVLVFRMRKRTINIAPYLILFNVLFLPIQIWYYFYSKI